MLTKGRCASHANLKLVKQSLKEKKKKKHDKKSSPCSQLLLIGKFFHKRSRDYSKVKLSVCVHERDRDDICRLGK